MSILKETTLCLEPFVLFLGFIECNLLRLPKISLLKFRKILFILAMYDSKQFFHPLKLSWIGIHVLLDIKPNPRNQQSPPMKISHFYKFQPKDPRCKQILMLMTKKLFHYRKIVVNVLFLSLFYNTFWIQSYINHCK